MSKLIVPGDQNNPLWIELGFDALTWEHEKCNVLSKISSSYSQKNFTKILATVGTCISFYISFVCISA